MNKEVIGNTTLYLGDCLEILPTLPKVDAVKYADWLARKNSEALSFIPRPRLQQYSESGQLLVEMENGEPCGFLVHGSGVGTMKIYQHCIQYDARRREHGLRLVARVVGKATRQGYEAIALKCAADLDANSFWRQAGFRFIRSIPGGKRRGRMLNVWFMPISACERIENAQRQQRMFA